MSADRPVAVAYEVTPLVPVPQLVGDSLQAAPYDREDEFNIFEIEIDRSGIHLTFELLSANASHPDGVLRVFPIRALPCASSACCTLVR